MATRADHGTLVLVVGPSGVGKDSLIAYARAKLDGDAGIAFPQRVITRPADDGAEDHVPASEEEYRRELTAGGFAVHWTAHGLGYGVPVGIVAELMRGRDVVVNVSRSVIPETRRRFRPLTIVLVTAPADALAERLRRRGRESEQRINGRLAQAVRYTVTGPDVVTLENAGPIAEAGERFVAILQSLRDPQLPNG